MKKYDIDIKEFVRHLENAGVTVGEGTGRFFEDGVEVDLTQCFRDLSKIDFSVSTGQIEFDFEQVSEPQKSYPVWQSSDLLVA